MQFTLVISLLGGHGIQADQVAKPAWTGQGTHRLIVQVDPVDLGQRRSDESVARLELDIRALIRSAGLMKAEQAVRAGIDLNSLQVHCFDCETGSVAEFDDFAGSRSTYDRPCRFEDLALPDDYPSRIGRASEQANGRPAVTIRARKGRIFNRLHDNDAGRIIWVHTQEAQKPSCYAIYFSLAIQDATSGVSPAPWIGDVDVLRQPEAPLGGYSHFTASTGDFNGDGLFDIVAGVEKGDVMWYPNLGRSGDPRFIGCRMMMDESGPIDTGWYAAPYLYDWDADGLIDLLAGTSGNAIVWWKNLGPAKDPKLRYEGFVRVGEERLAVPEAPVPESIGNTFARDYYNQPWVGDWNGDDIPDIITGGYTTGRIFYFEGHDRLPDGTPQLKLVGAVEADGKPIDTTWAAAPFAYDFTNDDNLDLVTGSWWYSGIHRKPEPGEIEFLMLYAGASSGEQAGLTRITFPKRGDFPRGVIARPSVVDWDNDGLSDLVVSENGGDLYCFRNVGQLDKPLWDVTAAPLTIPWGIVRSGGFTAPGADVDGDGMRECVLGNRFFRLVGSPYSPKREVAGVARVDGQAIAHVGPGYGDPYCYSTLCDWDGDGQQDMLWGTQQGNVFLHRKRANAGPFDFEAGIPLQLTNGEKLHVGPPVVSSLDEARDFVTLQGSRILLAADDFDADGNVDLCVSETFGNIWVFRNTKAGGTDSLEPGVRVAKLPSRSSSISRVFWDADQKPDLLISGTAAQPGRILLNQTEDGRLAFAEPQPIFSLPYVFWGPKFRAADWNGDGDEDLLIQSEFLAFYAERSFLEHGYLEANVVGTLQTRTGVETNPQTESE